LLVLALKNMNLPTKLSRKLLTTRRKATAATIPCFKRGNRGSRGNLARRTTGNFTPNLSLKPFATFSASECLSNFNKGMIRIGRTNWLRFDQFGRERCTSFWASTTQRAHRWLLAAMNLATLLD